MKKMISGIIAFSIIVTLFTGCDKERKNTESEDNIFGLDKTEEITLNIVGGLENFEGLEAVITKFESEYANCSVNYEMMDAYGDNIVSRLQNEGNATNMFLSSRGDFMDDGKLNGMAYALNSDESHIDLSAANQSINSSQEIDGKLYSLPLALSPRGIVINKTLLAEHKLSVPRNYDEFINVCETFKQAGITPIQAQVDSIGISLCYPYFANSIVHSSNYKTIFDELNSFTPGSGKYILDSCQRLEAVTKCHYIEYERTKDFKDNYDAAILNFFEGDVPFFPCTAETVSGMKKREAKSESFSKKPFEYEFICSPIGDEGSYCYWQIWQGISIYKDSEHPEWSRAFIDFLAKEENLKLLADTKGMPANIQNASDDERYASLYSMDPSHVIQASDFQISFYSQLNKAFQCITKQTTDPDHLNAEKAVEYYESLIAEKADEK